MARATRPTSPMTSRVPVVVPVSVSLVRGVSWGPYGPTVAGWFSCSHLSMGHERQRLCRRRVFA